MRAVTIRVTRQHIMEGYKQSCRFCPVALAIREVFGLEVVRADLEDIELEHTDCSTMRIWRLKLETPPVVEAFMNRFDYCRTTRWLRPFSFTVIHPQLPPRRDA